MKAFHSLLSSGKKKRNAKQSPPPLPPIPQPLFISHKSHKSHHEHLPTTPTLLDFDDSLRFQSPRPAPSPNTSPQRPLPSSSTWSNGSSNRSSSSKGKNKARASLGVRYATASSKDAIRAERVPSRSDTPRKPMDCPPTRDKALHESKWDDSPPSTPPSHSARRSVLRFFSEGDVKTRSTPSRSVVNPIVASSSSTDIRAHEKLPKNLARRRALSFSASVANNDSRGPSSPCIPPLPVLPLPTSPVSTITRLRPQRHPPSLPPLDSDTFAPIVFSEKHLETSAPSSSASSPHALHDSLPPDASLLDRTPNPRRPIPPLPPSPRETESPPTLPRPQLASKRSMPELDGVWRGFLQEVEEDLSTFENEEHKQRKGDVYSESRRSSGSSATIKPKSHKSRASLAAGVGNMASASLSSLGPPSRALPIPPPLPPLPLPMISVKVSPAPLSSHPDTLIPPYTPTSIISPRRRTHLIPSDHDSDRRVSTCSSTSNRTITTSLGSTHTIVIPPSHAPLQPGTPQSSRFLGVGLDTSLPYLNSPNRSTSVGEEDRSTSDRSVSMVSLSLFPAPPSSREVGNVDILRDLDLDSATEERGLEGVDEEVIDNAIDEIFALDDLVPAKKEDDGGASYLPSPPLTAQSAHFHIPIPETASITTWPSPPWTLSHAHTPSTDSSIYTAFTDEFDHDHDGRSSFSSRTTSVSTSKSVLQTHARTHSHSRSQSQSKPDVSSSQRGGKRPYESMGYRSRSSTSASVSSAYSELSETGSVPLREEDDETWTMVKPTATVTTNNKCDVVCASATIGRRGSGNNKDRHPRDPFEWGYAV